MSSLASITAEELAALIAERDALAGALRVATTERDLALERLRSLQRQLFAAKSEARGTDQKDLFLNEAEALAPTDQTPQAEVEDIDEEESTPVAGHQRKKRGRKPLDPALPREIVRHELPEAERVCAHDGHALVEIGAEVSEQMDVIPEQVRVLQHHRIKYACPCCDQSLKVAPTPARIIPRGLLTEQAQAWVITGKYQFGMPLYRTAVLLRRFGGDIASNTLASGIVRIGQAVQPVINLLRDHLLDSDLIYGDETTVQVLKEPGRKAQTKSFMWAQMNGTGPPVRLFAYAPGRGAVHAEKLYAGIRPGTTLVTDGYEVYNGIAKAGGLTHLGCWVHARRPFIKAEESIPKAARSPNQLASRFVRLIGKLYRAEALAKGWTPARRLRLRSRYSRSVVREIEQLLLTHLHSIAPSSLLSEAIGLQRGDVDLEAGVLTVRLTKFGKSRLVPLHSTTCAALRNYAERRDAQLASRCGPHFFVAERGGPLLHQYVHRVFWRLSREIGLRRPGDRTGPRVHDLRHRFAIRTLLGWYREGIDVEKKLPALSTYLGHTCVRDTYWYLSACPELMQEAAQRLDRRWEANP